jgi:hypothetical protein
MEEDDVGGVCRDERSTYKFLRVVEKLAARRPLERCSRWEINQC